MKKSLLIYFCVILTAVTVSCSSDDNLDADALSEVERDLTIDDIFNISSLPIVHLSFSIDEWNQLLAYYDEDKGNKNFVRSSFKIIFQNDSVSISGVGARIRGAWSRVRPEGENGQFHKSGETNWHHCSFSINFSKYIKDDEHRLGEVKKIDLKYFNIDPAYVREIYCYDLLRRFGINSAIRSSYCRLYIKVEGDDLPAYYGVYQMMEHIDKSYIKDRLSLFNDAEGNLWKCENVTLADTSDD